MSKHTKICNDIIKDWSLNNRGRLFLNKVRHAHSGKVTEEYMLDGKKIIHLYGAFSMLYGLEEGSADLVGFEFIDHYDYSDNKITFPIFCSIEIKTKSYKWIKPKQIDWLNFTVNFNGKAYIAREIDTGYELVSWSEQPSNIKLDCYKI